MQTEPLKKFLPSKESNFSGHEEVYQREKEDCWYIAPVVWVKSSEDTLTRCNFHVQEQRLKEECTETDEYYIYHFGGWIGSIEIVIVKANTRAYEIAVEIREDLNHDLILDDQLYYEYRDKYDRIELKIECSWSDNKVITKWIDISEDFYQNSSEEEVHDYIKILEKNKKTGQYPASIKILVD
tara:strand:+ start:589 stop:1137 length:549 start_codon:yes stop_codon:yes gene_type:complete